MMSSHFTPRLRSAEGGFLALSGIAAFCWLISTGSVFAGSQEVTALNAALSPQTIQTATGDQLAAAVVTVINGNAAFKPGVVAGEALKGAGSSAPDAGSKIANATLPLASVAADKIKYAADAVKTAGTKTGANVAQVPGFIQPIVDTDADAVAIAKKIPTVKSGVGAIFGGRALDLTTDAAKLALGNLALTKTNGLLAATQSIAQFIADTVADSDQFAHDLSLANLKQTTKIAPGVTAADPTNAGQIVRSIVSDAALSSVLAKAASLAKGVALVADIEQVQVVGTAIGEKIGSGGIGLSKVNSIAKALVQGITKRATTASGPNRLDNKEDEIGEIGAYFMNAIATNAAFDSATAIGAKKAAKVVVGLLKTIVKASKSKTDTTLRGLSAADVSGSVALTVKLIGETSGISAVVAQAIKDKLTNPNTAKKIVGKAVADATLRANVTAAIVEAYSVPGDTGVTLKYENGTSTGNVNDPETDTRNG